MYDELRSILIHRLATKPERHHQSTASSGIHFMCTFCLIAYSLAPYIWGNHYSEWTFGDVLRYALLNVVTINHDEIWLQDKYNLAPWFSVIFVKYLMK